MVSILSQDRQNIINAEATERISVDGKVVYAHTFGGAVIEIGKYDKPESLAKVMVYIAFSMATANEKGGKTVVMPSENTIINDKAIAENYIKVFLEKKQAGQATVDLSPELKDFLEKMKGGDGK